MAENDYKITLGDYIRFLTPFISALLVILLIYASFKVGVMYSCTGGYLSGNHCITPKIVKTMQVCETKISNCREVCKMFEIKDSSRYEGIFNITAPEHER